MTLDPYIFEYFIALFLAIFLKHLLWSLKNGQIWSKCAILRPKNSKKIENYDCEIKKAQNGANLSETINWKAPLPYHENPPTAGGSRGSVHYFYKILAILGPKSGLFWTNLEVIWHKYAQNCQKWPQKGQKSVFCDPVAPAVVWSTRALSKMRFLYFSSKNLKNDLFHTFPPIWITVGGGKGAHLTLEIHPNM